MPKPTPEEALRPIMTRWSTVIGVSFELRDDGEDVVIKVLIPGEKPATARIRREFLGFPVEEIAPHVNRVIGAAIGDAV